MKTINIILDKNRQYPIIIGCGDEFNSAIQETISTLINKRDVITISDSNVAPLYQNVIESWTKNTEIGQSINTLMTAGEQHKTLQTLSNFYTIAAQNLLDRRTIAIALGGGVVGDTAGFFAASWQRGINFIQVPTTLLAMVDSSVGGKVAVDLPEGKNLVGAFHQPIAVIADLSTLNTLPEREWKCGFAEIVKYGMILDQDFFNYLDINANALINHNLEILEYVVHRCCQLKQFVVEQDEKEQGLREVLNYGHTFGHALEMLSGYEVLNHGEGVAIGMKMAAETALALELINQDVIAKQDALLAKLDLDFLPAAVKQIKPEAILEAMRADKKSRQGKLRLVLPTKIGHCQTFDNISEDIILEAIKKVLSR